MEQIISLLLPLATTATTTTTTNNYNNVSYDLYNHIDATNVTTSIVSPNLLSFNDHLTNINDIISMMGTPQQWSAYSLKSLYYLFNKLRYMFYLVLPSETMFASLDQVPRYVAEVSSIWSASMN